MDGVHAQHVVTGPVTPIEKRLPGNGDIFTFIFGGTRRHGKPSHRCIPKHIHLFLHENFVEPGAQIFIGNHRHKPAKIGFVLNLFKVVLNPVLRFLSVFQQIVQRLLLCFQRIFHKFFYRFIVCRKYTTSYFSNHSLGMKVYRKGMEEFLKREKKNHNFR